MSDISKRLADLSPEKRELLLRLLQKEAGDIPRTQTKTELPIVVSVAEDRHKPFPLTDIQQAYWIGRSSSFELGGVSCHIYYEIESINLDVERLQLALRRLIERHEMLRAVILSDGRQQILEEIPPYELRVVDMRGLGDRQAALHLEAVRSELSHQVLPCDKAPMFEFRASLLGNQLVRLHVSLDVLVSDARSFGILFDELHQIYENPDTILRPLDLSFRDYVLTTAKLKDSELYRRSKEYWLKRLSTLPPAPELPLATNPSAVRKVRVGRRSARIESENWRRLKDRAAKAGLTPSVLLVAAYAEVLGLWSKNPRFTINLTLFNRLPLHPQINEVIGDFTSVTMLEVDTAAQPTFKSRARHLQQQLWDDMDHSYFGGVQVLRELARQKGDSHGAAMPVVFTSVLPDQADNQSPHQTSRMWNVVYDITQTPQVWLDHTVVEEEGALVIRWDVVEELFPAGLLDDMFDAYCRLLWRLTDDDGSWQESRFVMASKLLPPAQLEQRRVVNTTESPLANDLLHSLFYKQALKRPEQTAVITPKRTLSYRELQNRANQVAHWLRQRGAHPNSLVAVVMEKGWEQVAGVLGVLASGAAYLPIDATLPKERLAYILEHGQVSLVLTQTWHARKIDWPAGIQRFCVDQADQSGLNESSLEPVQKPEDLAYVIYTSGSTGLPKGVVIDHRGAVNTIQDINQRFRVKPEDRVLALSALNFDLSVYDIFGLLAAGGSIVMPEAYSELDPNHWAELVVKHGVTMWNTVPALMQMLVEYLTGVSESLSDSLRLVMMSGDWIPVDLPDRIKNMAADIKVVSLGGATEASIWSILYPIEKVEPSWISIPYGRPMVNQSFHVLNDALAPCPVWVPGQLYIGGIGLAKGYWRDEEKTQNSFISLPQTGERLYRTGDLGRYLPDGNIEFLGREDFQIKIRGHRIELGEIETALLQHPKVQASVVTAVGDVRENKRLVAYVVPVQETVSGPQKEKSSLAATLAEDACGNIIAQALVDPLDLSGAAASEQPVSHAMSPVSSFSTVDGSNADELREFLRGKLPEYMVPAIFLLMDALPLSANGKVDRKALPKPEMGTAYGEEYVAPRTSIEWTITDVWKEVLNQERIGVHDDFFQLGGDSLLATRVMSRINRFFILQLPLRRLFEGRTIESLAEAIAESAEPSLEESSMHLPKLLHVPREQQLPLSFSQERLWFLSQLESENAAYHMSVGVRLEGQLRVDLLEQAFAEIVRRHEILRTSFEEFEGKSVQVISSATGFYLQMVDLQKLPEAERETRSRQIVAEEIQRPFDLSAGALLRVILVRLAQQEHILVVVMHHIVTDGWSLGVFTRELEALYRAFSDGRPSPLADLPIQYGDYAAWQREWLKGTALEQQLEYWKKQLGGGLPVLQLPTDRPRPAVETHRGANETFALSPTLAEKLKSLSLRHRVTLFVTLLAALKTLLFRYTGQTDFAVGSPIANRNRPELEGLIGFFVNSLVLRTNLSGDPSFAELLEKVQEITLEAFAHQEVPFEKVVEVLNPARDMSHSPLFQAMFAFQNLGWTPVNFPGLTLTPEPIDTGASMFDLSLFMWEEDNGLSGRIEYNTDLFEADTIGRMVEHFKSLLEGITAHPEKRLSELEILTEEERHQILMEWNATEAAYPANKTVVQLFEEQAERSPEGAAVTCAGRSLTYGELNRRANQVAQRLQAFGVRAGEVVGIYLDRSIDMVVGLLGILKAGGAYTPLDPYFPADRIEFMLEDSYSGILITQSHLRGNISGFSGEVVCLDSDWEAISIEQDSNLAVQAGPNDLAYVIYTSGSTGNPKGVQISHRALVNFLCSMQREPGVTAADSFLSVTTMSFDIFGLELFLPLITGARVVIAERDDTLDGSRLTELLKKHGVTVMQATPSTWRLLIESGWSGHEGLKALCGGEAFPSDLVGALLERCKELWNLYGPTETTIWSTVYRIASKEAPILIGHPIANTQVYILDNTLQLVPTGVVGELHIGGDGLSRGYLNRPELTAEKFIPHPFSQEPGARIYKTGDLARYRPDGTIECLGRMDHQVKLRGFRIELGEIEARMKEVEGVGNCVVVLREDRPGDHRLVAYYVGREGGTVTVLDMRSYLRLKLPDYMMPQHFMELPSIPLTPNGKVDRKALPKPEADGALELGHVAPRSDTEEKVATIWQEVLNRGKVGVHDNFFELGGHSLLATQVMSRITCLFGIQLPLKSLFETKTLGILANLIDTILWSYESHQTIQSLDTEERETIEI